MARTLTMLALAAVVAAPVALTAQTTVRAGASTTVRAETEGQQRQTRGGASADAEVQLAVRAGLPREPVARAAAQARARGRSEAQAARAAAEVRTRLQASHDAITASGRTAIDAEIIAGADALAQGASRADLAVIARRAPQDRQLTASFRALVRLGARDDNFAQAAAAIATRLESGTSDRAIGRLAATGSVDAMLRGTTGVTGATGGILGGGASVTGGVTGTVGGIVP
jgi:hypothetical protein